MKLFAIMQPTTARLIGAILRVRAGSNCLNQHVAMLYDSDPNAIVIVATDTSVWTWPVVQGARAS